MRSWRSTLDVAANVGLISCCILFGVFFFRNHAVYSGNPIPERPQVAKIGLAGSSLVGKGMPVQGIDWTKSQQTVVLVLQEGCRFCDESTPFYQRLTKEFSDPAKIHFVAALPESNDESRKYLKEKMIGISDVKQVSPTSIGVRGTPTLLLVDNTGTVLEQWNGKLPAAQEDAVIARLKQ